MVTRKIFSKAGAKFMLDLATRERYASLGALRSDSELNLNYLIVDLELRSYACIYEKAEEAKYLHGWTGRLLFGTCDARKYLAGIIYIIFVCVGGG